MHSDDHGPKWTPTERKMLGLVREFEGSGMRWGEFARSRGMTPARFSWWKSHLRRKERAVARPGESTFVEVKVDAISARSDLPVVIEIGAGRRVLVSPGFDADTLRRVVQVVASC